MDMIVKIPHSYLNVRHMQFFLLCFLFVLESLVTEKYLSQSLTRVQLILLLCGLFIVNLIVYENSNF